MVAPWIKMRVDLRNDPAVVSIARACRLDVDAVVGKLHAVWSWADGVTDDGMVDGVDAALVDEIARRKGFAAAMATTPRSHWLVIRDTAVEFPRFGRHNGKSAKRRATDAERKREDRDHESDDRPPDVLELSASEADKDRTREEKRTSDSLRSSGAARDSRADGEGQEPAKPPATTRGPHAAFRRAWEALFQALKGSPYAFNGSKDGTAVDRILTLAGLRKRPPSTPEQAVAAVSLAESMARRLLESDDPYYHDKGVDLTTLSSQWNRLVSAKASQPVARRALSSETNPLENDADLVRKVRQAADASYESPRPTGAP